MNVDYVRKAIAIAVCSAIVCNSVPVSAATVVAKTSSVAEPRLVPGGPDLVVHTPDGPGIMRAPRAIAPQQLAGGYWRTDNTFTATLRIRNLLVDTGLDVRPSLQMADGSSFDLPSIRVEASSVRTINLNQALVRLGSRLGEHASNFGSVRLSFNWGWATAVQASVENLDVKRSLIFSYPLDPGMTMREHATNDTRVIDGLWWKRTAQTSAFVVANNTSNAPVGFVAQFFGSRGAFGLTKRITLQPSATARLDVDANLAGVPTDQRQEGGVRISFEGKPGSIFVCGGLEDPAIGYSANMPLVAGPTQKTTTSDQKRVTLVSMGVMVGAGHHAMGFRDTTNFEPYLILRNAAAEPRTVDLTLHFETMMQRRSVVVPSLILGSKETRRVDISDVMRRNAMENFSGSLTMEYSFSGRLGELQIGGGSVDETGSYVLSVRPQALAKGRMKQVPYWLSQGTKDTMFSFWNPSEKAENLLLTLSFAGQKYKVPIYVDAHSSAMLNISDVIKSQKPDSDGIVMPPQGTDGAATLTMADGVSQQMATLFSAATFDTQNATCGGEDLCGHCDDFIDYWLFYNPWAFLISATKQMSSKVRASDNTVYDVTSGSAWTSENTSIATIGYSTGNASGVTAGDVYLDGFYTATTHGAQCYVSGNCDDSYMSDGAPGAVQPTFSFSCDTTNITIGATAPVAWKTGTCYASSVQPTGGSFTYSAANTKITVSPNGNSVNYTSANVSTAEGDTSVNATYTVNSVSTSVSGQALTVRKPTSLVRSSSTLTANSWSCSVPCLAQAGTCNGTAQTCNYNAPTRVFVYSVKDQFNKKFEDVQLSAGVNVTETVTPVSNTCPNFSITTGSSLTSPFTDTLAKCHTCCLANGAGCTTVVTQVINVNGYDVATYTLSQTCSDTAVQ